MHRLHLLNALLLILLVAWPALAAPPLQGGNRLQNGNFEGGFSQREAGEVVVANGWERWWQDGTPEEQQNGFLKRPEYKPDSSRAGGTQQKWFSNYATHNGGIFQRVGVPRGSKLTFTARVYVWSHDRDDFNESSKPGNYVVFVGIDPTGGTNALAGTVVWSPARMEYDHWLDLRVETTAQADAVTVFLRGSVEYRVKNNNSYWDDAVLTAVEPAPTARPPTSTPKPTATPTEAPPTPTPSITPTPTDTPTPTASPTPTDTPTPTLTSTPTRTATPTATPTPEVGSLCVAAYEDADQNGQWDAEERLLAGRRIELLDGQGNLLGEYLTDGENEPYCFPEVPPGRYRLVKETVVGGATASTQVAVVAGESLTVEFGDRVPPTPTAQPADTPTPVPASGLAAIGSNIYRVSGILVLVLVAGIAIGYMLIQRQV
jgi:outer membrane biosynthesis protein TonB